MYFIVTCRYVMYPKRSVAITENNPICGWVITLTLNKRDSLQNIPLFPIQNKAQ